MAAMSKRRLLRLSWCLCGYFELVCIHIIHYITECKIAVVSELHVIEFQIATVGELRQLILIEF